jgi:hypothetical protein
MFYKKTREEGVHMLKKRFTKCIALMLALLFVVLPYQNAFAAADYILIPGVEQGGPTWCWAACCESVLRGTFGRNISQSTIVRDTKSYIPEEGASYLQIAQVFNDYGYSCKTSSRFLDFATVKSEIKAKRPIIANLVFRNSIVGHSVVITACDTRDGVNYIWYMDPHTGREYMQVFNDFVSGFKYYFNGQNTFWSTTVYGFKKK